MSDESGHRSGARGGAGKSSRPAAKPASVSQRYDAGAYAVGGNASTLAFVTTLRPEGETIVAQLLPLAQTPIGDVAGDRTQRVTVPLEGLLDWLDRSFPPEDETAFLAPAREIDLLVRAGWNGRELERIDEREILNPEDLPEATLDALAHAAQPLVACSACRRLCVRDEFVLRERQLCAWDYHRQQFGRRGPWHTGRYEDRHFAAIPQAAYVAPPLLEEIGVDVILALSGVPDEAARAAIDAVLDADAQRAHLAVRVVDGYALLRER